jgi:hypothetical protein
LLELNSPLARAYACAAHSCDSRFNSSSLRTQGVSTLIPIILGVTMFQCGRNWGAALLGGGLPQAPPAARGLLAARFILVLKDAGTADVL